MNKKFSILYVILLLVLVACQKSDKSNPVESNYFSDNNLSQSSTEGFGVSGLLFENNLIMFDRDNETNRSEFFVQMYFTRLDAADFPVWGTFPKEFILDSGVPKDGIPALTNPEFSPSWASISYLDDSDLILGAVVNNEIKAYPEKILWWHEIINDIIGTQKVVMSFCPLTGTGLLLKFPSEGKLTDKLELLPVVETTWRKWKEMHPETKVISDNTRYKRDYRRYPYGSYREEYGLPAYPLETMELDTRFVPKHTILGLIDNTVQKAYPFSRLVNSPIVNDNFGQLNVLVVSDISERMAIPYNRIVDGQVLTFTLLSENPFRMIDNETHSIWDETGKALNGPLKGKGLKQLSAYNAFWFAWSTFWPSTLVYGE